MFPISIFELVGVLIFLSIAAINCITAILGIRWTLQRRRNPPRKNAYLPFVSVICCAWNEERVIERKIRNYLSLDYPRDRFEVIIVDNGSTDRTPEICQRFADRGLIKFLRIPEHHELKAPGLDRAVRELARGEVIVHSDADSVCAHDWIQRIVQPLQDPQVGAVVGAIYCGNAYRNALAACRGIEDLWQYVGLTAGRYRITGIAPIVGANYAFRRDAWERVGGHGTHSLVEDYEFTIQLLAAGYRTVYEPLAESWQEEVETLTDYFRQRQRWYGGPLQVHHHYRRELKIVKRKYPLFMILAAINGLLYLPLTYAFLQLIYGITTLAVHKLLVALLIYALYAATTTYLLVATGYSYLLLHLPTYLFLDHWLFLACGMLVLLKTALKRKIRWTKVRHFGSPLIIPPRARVCGKTGQAQETSSE